MRDTGKPDQDGPVPSSPAVKPSGKRQAAIPFVLVAVFLDVLGIGLIIPVLPTLIGTPLINRAVTRAKRADSPPGTAPRPRRAGTAA